MNAQITCSNDDTPAVAVLVHLGQVETVGDGICESCASCTDTACGEIGTILDAEYQEPWCDRHAELYSGGEGVRGPDIVPIDSNRARDLIAEHGGQR
ncbi:hypothetical protein [Alloactinosynnema sp. L-07]|uniref:hypothetical protein n=1 Tax=Alloactinosynnema sp. L-07 TaxID=1653480 RepID=UPI00065F0470|nr:hypothetical protein [Alloactinosynnema sp. L-07]CRK55452.1 hypothetical protein [Alloactinosynnema sp. L-07]